MNFNILGAAMALCRERLPPTDVALVRFHSGAMRRLSLFLVLALLSGFPLSIIQNFNPTRICWRTRKKTVPTKG